MANIPMKCRSTSDTNCWIGVLTVMFTLRLDAVFLNYFKYKDNKQYRCIHDTYSMANFPFMMWFHETRPLSQLECFVEC